METSTKSIGINYGIYLGVILALSTVVAYAVNLNLMTNTMYGIAQFAITIILAVFAIYKAKKAMSNFITFKQAFTVFFITIALAILIKSVVDYVVFNIVDTEAAVTLQQQAIEKQVEVLRGFGMDEEIIAKTVEEGEKENIYSIKNLTIGLFFAYAFYAVIGLIAALIMKRNPENA